MTYLIVAGANLPLPAAVATGSIISSIEELPATTTALSYEVRLVNPSLAMTATIATRYREVGGSWADAAWAMRIRTDWTDTTIARSEGFAGMVFHLSPGTTYEIEVTVTDGETQDVATAQFATRSIPRTNPTSPTTINVPADKTLAQAVSEAAAGQVIVVADGAYSGDLDLAANGTLANPIILRGESQEGVVLTTNSAEFGSNAFEVTGEHWIVERVTIENTHASGYAVQARNAKHLCVRKCKLKGRSGFDGRHFNASQVNQNFTIYDNVIEGQKSWSDYLTAIDANDTSTLRGGEGIVLMGTGHEVYQNTVQGVGDALGVENVFFNFTGSPTIDHMNRGIVFRNNRVDFAGDNGLELDDAYACVAAHTNKILNAADYVSAQPNVEHGGPRYFFRNLGPNLSRSEMYKTKTSGADFVTGVFIVANTGYVSTQASAGTGDWGAVWSRVQGDNVQNIWFLDNLLYVTQARTEGLFTDENDGTWRWYDYNAYIAPNIANQFFGYTNWDHTGGGNMGRSWTSLANFQAQGFQAVAPFGVTRDVDANSFMATAADVEADAIPSTYRTLADPATDIKPSAGSALLAPAGIDIPQLSHGAAIGARDRDGAEPTYGNTYIEGATSLALAANGLLANQNTDFAAGAVPYPLWTINTPDNGATIFQWGTHYYRDDTNKQFFMFGKGAGNDPATHLKYDEASETWSELARDLYDGKGGHAYDAYSFDPATLAQYYIDYTNGFGTTDGLEEYDESSNTWSDTGINMGSAQAAGLAWHPNLFGAGSGGLVECSPNGIFAINIGTAQRTSITSVTGVGQAASCVYDPDSDAVYCGGGEGNTGHYKVTSSTQATPIASLPTATGGSEEATQGGKHAVLCPSPYSDGVLYLIGFNISTDYWTSDDQGATWTNRGSHGLLTGGNSIISVIRDYNVIWQQKFNGYSVASRSRIWKPAVFA